MRTLQLWALRGAEIQTVMSVRAVAKANVSWCFDLSFRASAPRW